MSERENFLSRWSKRKQAVAEAEKNVLAEDQPVAEVVVAEEQEEPFDPASLPSVESLTAESDVSPFLRKNVPQALRNAALRHLWSLDPHLQGPDVLADYAWDFNKPEIVTGFGELAPGTDTQAMLRWIGVEKDPQVPAPEQTLAADVTIEPPSILEPPADSEKHDSSVENAATQHQRAEIAEQFANVPRIRRHGGALPN